jgi:GntR family transcriptional regulator
VRTVTPEVSLRSCRPIDRASPVPYYHQLKDSLKDNILSCTWLPGTTLPSEADICEAFGVSRITVRQALAELEVEGLVRRERGRGTFVAEPKIRERIVGHLTGFYEDMTAQGLEPQTRVLNKSVVEAPPSLAEILEVMPGVPLIRIERLRMISGEPVLLSVTHIPEAICPNLTSEDLEKQSLYALLEKRYGVQIARGRRVIEAIAASENDAGLLGVANGTPLVLIKSITYLSDGRPVEYYEAKHRGDRTRFEVEVVRVLAEAKVSPLHSQAMK